MHSKKEKSILFSSDISLDIIFLILSMFFTDTVVFFSKLTFLI